MPIHLTKVHPSDPLMIAVLCKRRHHKVGLKGEAFAQPEGNVSELGVMVLEDHAQCGTLHVLRPAFGPGSLGSDVRINDHPISHRGTLYADPGYPSLFG